MRSLTLFFVVLLAATAIFAQSKPSTSKPKPKPASAKPVPTPAKKPDEKAVWEKASKVEDTAARVAALKKFNETYPKSTRRNEALSMITTARVEMANAKLATDADGALALFKDAAAEAPKPVPDSLWTDTLAKLPANLYFRGARDAAYQIASSLEDKTDGNAAQTLALAAFYLTVEDGSSARRLAERVITADERSTAAYQTLGLAYRVDFQLEDSANAFAKVVELDPYSLPAKRGLAEMKRSLGKADEAVSLYREILAKEEGNVPAQTGLILSLFDAGKRADAESEMAKSLVAAPGNVILLAGAAYWYAAHGEGDRAVEYAQKAGAADPRYIWSHIALARGYLLQKQAAEAEKALFNAQRYGNFPTVQYELASARLAAGYYRDAADELAKSFSIKDGVVSTRLGGRIVREGKDLSEVIGYERRASIFTPAAADDAENAARLAALLEMKQAVDASEPAEAAVVSAVDKFVAGDDKMRVHRLLFAARTLLDKRIALPKVVELAKAASSGVDAGVDLPASPTAVMASEIYEVRSASAARGEYVNVPSIARNVMANILRGEIESVSGWAHFLMNDPNEAAVRLRRAVNVLPVDSAWWRTSMWRLGSALAASGKDAEALDAYVKTYKSAGVVDPIRYTMIQAVYKRVNGNLDGLAAKIGPDPNPPIPEATPTPSPSPETKPQDAVATPSVAPTPTPETLRAPVPETPKPCALTASEENVIVSASGTPLSIMISPGDDIILDDLTGTSSSPADLTVKREVIAGVRTRAIFVLNSASGKAGLYTVLFEMPCGKKEVSVTVK